LRRCGRRLELGQIVVRDFAGTQSPSLQRDEPRGRARRRGRRRHAGHRSRRRGRRRDVWQMRVRRSRRRTRAQWRLQGVGHVDTDACVLPCIHGARNRRSKPHIGDFIGGPSHAPETAASHRSTSSGLKSRTNRRIRTKPAGRLGAALRGPSSSFYPTERDSASSRARYTATCQLVHPPM
jgi:hypothetical protein